MMHYVGWLHLDSANMCCAKLAQTDPKGDLRHLMNSLGSSMFNQNFPLL